MAYYALLAGVALGVVIGYSAGLDAGDRRPR